MNRMWKMTGWLAKTVAAGLIISFLSIWTTGYIVNSYVETLLKQYNLPLEVQPMALSGVWGKLWGANSTPTQKEQPSGSEKIDNGSGQKDESPVAVDAFRDESLPPLTDVGIGSGSKAEGGTAGEEAGGVPDAAGGQTEGAVDAAEGDEAPALDGSETAMTTDDLAEVKEQMSDADKEELFGLLMSKLPQEAWQSISSYMENGLTEEELNAVQQLMAQYLDKDQYERMMNILKKY
ncbi:hypothetical protein [Paenibacillus sp. NEAU-GSW1]|uniref:hypothetical protein n=1 Tax=Paenibacillus sp. NEAU-GSW1 TaxID=2682486 RepID=UPI0012E2A7EE|nr:hypothetical protein [Paenibacillus sp. NEAU-GSW1]MUT67473.1 hypothetical protein [Paenibacillus sp. NEAU-GSW1]